MPLGDAIGEFSAKITSLNQTEMGDGQRRITVDTDGESTGQISGHTLTSLVAEVSPGQPSPSTATGTIMTTSGAAVQFNGWGVSVLEAEFKVRFRGAARQMSADPALAAMNNAITAVEAEIDLKAMTLKGTVCLWP